MLAGLEPVHVKALRRCWGALEAKAVIRKEDQERAESVLLS